MLTSAKNEMLQECILKEMSLELPFNRMLTSAKNSFGQNSLNLNFEHCVN